MAEYPGSPCDKVNHVNPWLPLKGFPRRSPYLGLKVLVLEILPAIAR